MTVTDADHGRLRYEYEVYDAAHQIVATSSATVPSGTPSTWTVNNPPLADGEYHWRGRGCDARLCGPWSNPGHSDQFAFTVKQPTAARLPVVTSTDYPEDGWNGGPGKPGQFTFSPGTVTAGVRTYYYTLNFGPTAQIDPDSHGTATITLTPSRDGINVLDVFAVDALGKRSDTFEYSFKVRPVQGRWYWPLNEGTGTTAATQPVNDRPLGISGTGVTWSTPGAIDSTAAVHFTGAGDMNTTAAVLDTTAAAGFSVAAWVRLPTEADAGLPKENRAAISQDGLTTSMFRLGYRTDVNVDQDETGAPDPAWCFSLASSDSDRTDDTTACTTQYLAPGVWTHLAGVADPIHNQIRLYVNGSPSYGGAFATATGKAQWSSTGAFSLGRALTGSTPAERWIGDLDEVHAVPRVWSEEEIDQMALPL